MSKLFLRQFALDAVDYLLSYQTPRIVYVGNRKIAIINRVLQLAIFAYIVGYVIVFQKGYQMVDTEIFSSVSTKVKGVSFTNRSDLPPEYNRRIWDTPDYVIPAQQTNAFFIMTDFLATKEQQRSTCAEEPYVAPCRRDSDCQSGKPTKRGNGVMTGKCIYAGLKRGQEPTCEIHAWCPVEEDEKRARTPMINEAENFTVLLKNRIDFAKFRKKRRNIIESISNASYLATCLYHHRRDPFCPIFRIGDILKGANIDFARIARSGGIVGIQIMWDCNFDWNERECVPRYFFRRLDDEHAAIAPGWNFRYANYYRENGVEKRDQYKIYGILFTISVHGRGGKFHIIPLALNVASGLAMLVLATVVCDILMIYVFKGGNFYVDKKYFKVEPPAKEAGKPKEETSSLIEHRDSNGEPKQRMLLQRSNSFEDGTPKLVRAKISSTEHFV